MSCVLYEGENGYACHVREVEVNQDTGAITVKRMVISNDSGPISNPDGLKNQMEGGALQGLSRALGEEVTWDAQQITSVDWRTYRSLPIGFSVPTIDVVLLDRPEHEAMGAGETSITLIAVGRRQRRLRCHRRALPPGAVHAGKRQGRSRPAAVAFADSFSDV